MNLPNFNRRDFLNTSVSAGLAAGLAQGGFFSAPTYASENKKLGVALVGLGSLSANQIAPAFQKSANCKLTAIVTGTPEKEKIWSEKYGIGRDHIYNYNSFEKLASDETVDLVYIVLPNSMHAEYTIRAAKAGKHVLCEKPMAMSVAECDRMIAACQLNGVQLGIAYYRHSYQVLHRVKTLLADGIIGRPVIAQINAFERFNPAPEHARHWFVKKELAGGGPMMDFGCHRIEVLLNVLGDITDVQSSVGQVLFQRAVEDTAVALFTFANQARAVLSVTHAAQESQDTFQLFGSAGSLHLASLNRGELRISTANEERVEQHPPHANLHQPLIDAFAAAILTQTAPPVGGQMGREVQRIESLIYEENT